MVTSILQPGIEVQCLHSDIIGQNIRLDIKLPWRYERSDAAFPVLYALDANRAFPLYATPSLIFETPGTNTKEIVIVGVGYEVDCDRLRGLAQWAAWRTRDLTPVRDEKTEIGWNERLSALAGGETVDVHSGGAATFLKSLRGEIVPFVEAHYRVSSADRGLAGYSYGGLFTLYTLFHAPEMFTRYFAGSPSLWPSLFQYEEDYAAAHADLKALLLMTAGSREVRLLEEMGRLADRLRSRRYPSLEVRTHVFDGEGHASAYAAAVSRALCVLYNEEWFNS
jgi:predicted alpha/beta superfamily hydrolase